MSASSEFAIDAMNVAASIDYIGVCPFCGTALVRNANDRTRCYCPNDTCWKSNGGDDDVMSALSAPAIEAFMNGDTVPTPFHAANLADVFGAGAPVDPTPLPSEYEAADSAAPGTLTALVEGTGEVVETTPGTALSVTTLKAYVDARAHRDALRLARDARIKALELEDGPLREIIGQLAPLEIGVSAVENALAGAFDPNVRAAVSAPITVDAGFIRVTWGKPRETWSLAKPASWYGQPESKYSLMDRLRRHIDEDEQMSAVLDTVLDWLRPTRKLSAPSDPTITIRAQKGGAA